MTEEKKVAEPGKFRQLFVALVANVSALSYGICIGWQSPSMPQLQNQNSPVGAEPMTDEQTSWLSGVMCLSGAAVSVAIGTMANRYGRKVTGCLAALPLCANWLFIIFATEHLHIFIARFLAGMGGGTVLFLVPLYVSEISCDEIRGMLGSLMVFVLNGGILLGYVLGAVLSFQVFAIVAFAFPLFYLAFFIFVPESPVYLVRRNRLRDAARSLTWLKAGHQPSIEREMLRLQAEAKETTVPAGRSIKLSDLFRDKATIKGLIITLGLFGGQQLAGIFAMTSYTESIFRISGSSLSPNGSAIIVGLIQLFGSYLSTSLMERTGRRPLLLTSCAGMGICNYVLGIFCYLQTLQYNVTSFNWIPIVAFSVYMISYNLGMGPGPYVVSSEIISRDMSSLVITIGMVFVWSMAFVVVKLFPWLVHNLGMHGCFILLGSFCASTFVFVFLLIPETKSRPRQMILDQLNGVPYALDKKQYLSSNSVIEKNVPPPEHV